MGKKLVILGADFSENGISVGIPINVGQWTNSKAYVSNNNTSNPLGRILNSSVFKISDKVELPNGVRSIKYTRPIYTTGAGQKSNYGLVFWLNATTPISGDDIPMGTRSVEEVTIEIPANAVYVSFTYFMDTDVPFVASCFL